MEGQRRILDLCVDAGETLLANGAEIYRVQQTMEIIARSYGARSFHVYVLTNGLFASMEDGGAVQSAAVRSTPRVEMNLGRISAVNALSREIVAGRVPLEEAFARLAQIRATRGLPGWLMVSASAFSAACFCYLFGGSAVDAFTALAPGFAVGLFTRALARARTPLNKLVSNMLSAGVVALVSLACVQALGRAGGLYFPALSTPVPELLDALRRARVPEVVGDLAVLIYRYIFILFATFRSMRDAAASRLGYAGPVRSLRTTGRVYGGLLAHSFRRAQACFDAMESRCYDGGIRFLTRVKPVRAPHALVCGALTAGMVLALVCGA